MIFFPLQYFSIFVNSIMRSLLSCISLVFFYISIFQKGDSEKLSAYICDFDSFDDARNMFNVRFYLVVILFIIFDLEIRFLFFFFIVFGSLRYFVYRSVSLSFLFLTIIYEWKKEVLE